MAGCGGGTGRRRGRLGAAIGLIVLTATMSGCAAATPLCDEGESLADAGRLSAATEKFAQADQRGEGDCADAGLSGAGSRYADSFVNVARGAVAEEKGDLEAAVTAYRAALVFDVENATARQDLARLQQPVPEFRPPQPVPAPPLPAAPDRGAWTLGLVTVGLLCAVLGLLTWLALTWRRTARKSRLEAASARTELENAREQIPAIRDPLTELRTLLHEEFDKTAGRLDELGERIRHDPAAKYELLAAVDVASKREQADAAAMERLRALDDRVSELVDVLDDVVQDRTASAPQRSVQR